MQENNKRLILFVKKLTLIKFGNNIAQVQANFCTS
jgi:hypothetical protein